MIPFKFFKGKVYTDEYTAQRPYGISNRHWNILPQDLRGGSPRRMEVYIEGWEAARSANYNNPYHDPHTNRGEIWNRGFHAWWERRNGIGRNYTDVNPHPPIDERYPEYYNTDEFVFCDVTQIMFDPIWLEPYKFMLFRHIEDGNTVQGQRIGPDHPMWYFPDVI